MCGVGWGGGGVGVMCTPDTGSAACFCSEPTDFSLVCSGERSLRHLLVVCRDTHSSILFLPRACWITQYLHNRIHRLHIIKIIIMLQEMVHSGSPGLMIALDDWVQFALAFLGQTR